MNYSLSDISLYPQGISRLFAGLSLPAHIGPSILLPIFLIFALVYSIVSGVIFYHWITYGMGSKTIVMAEILFVSVSVLLFILAFIATH